MDSLIDSGSPVIISSAKTTHFEDFDPFAPQTISSTSSMNLHDSTQKMFSNNFDLLDDFVESHGGGKSDIKFNYAIKYEEDDTRDVVDREADNDDDYLYTVPPTNECSVHEVHYTPEELAMYNNDEEDEQDENGLDLNEAMVEDSHSSHLNEKEAELFYSKQYENVRNGQINQPNNNSSIFISSFESSETGGRKETSYSSATSNHINYHNTNGGTDDSPFKLENNQHRTVTVITNTSYNHKNVNNSNETHNNMGMQDIYLNANQVNGDDNDVYDDERYSKVKYNQELEKQSRLNDAKTEAASMPKIMTGEGERKKLSELKQEELEEYSPPTKPRHTSSSSSNNENKAASQISIYAALGENMCKKCEKRVYEMEKITVDNVVFHKTCFRCVICKRMLSLGNYSTNDGLMYCKPDFLKSFKERGNYSFSKEVKFDTIENIDGRNHVETSHINECDAFDGHDSEYMSSEYPIKPEEMPSIELKSVRSMFEKKAEDSSVPFKKPSDGSSPSNRINLQSTQSKEKSPYPTITYSNQNELLGGHMSEDVIQSSIDSVKEEELPPPAITKNVRAIFERGLAADTNIPKINAKPLKRTPETNRQLGRAETAPSTATPTAIRSVHLSTPIDQHPSKDAHQAEDQTRDELPQAGTTQSLLAQWRNIEVKVDSGRSRSDQKSISGKRSQSLSRVEYVNRMNSREHIPVARSSSRTEEDLGGSEVARATRARLARYKEMALNEQRENEASKPREASNTKAFKWQVKEPTPMNRGVLIVHGDVPRQINQMSPPINASHGEPTYATIDGHFSPHNMPDPNNIQSALQRFKALEDPTKAPPLPVVRGDKTERGKVEFRREAEFRREEIYEEVKNEEEDLPASGTTRSLLAKFQQMAAK